MQELQLEPRVTLLDALRKRLGLTGTGTKQVGRPVRLMVSRPQMFAFVGHRPHTIQKLALGATKDGTLTAIRHDGVSEFFKLTSARAE